MNIDGVGLFRSEFLYMQNTHFPTEEEQFVVYKEAAELASQELTNPYTGYRWRQKNCLTMNLKKRRIHSLDGEQSVFLWT